MGHFGRLGYRVKRTVRCDTIFQIAIWLKNLTKALLSANILVDWIKI